MKRTWKQIGSLILSVCMVMTMLPTTAFAETGTKDSGAGLGTSGEITAFAALDADIAAQTVDTGTAEEELNLPTELTVTVTRTVTVTTGSSITAAVSGNDTATDSEAQEPETQEETQKIEEEATVPVSGWTSAPAYDGDAEGDYVFTPTLALQSGITLADGVTAPTITVTVEEMAIPTLRSAIAPLSIGTDIEISEVNFPDDLFRNWLKIQSYGSGDVLTEDEIAGITSMDVNNKMIADLTGIEYFTALTTLNCSSNALSTLDVSGLTNLTTLNCSYNYLNTLDVSGLTNLTTLNCSSSALSILDVSALTQLTTLDCSYNQLSTLDASTLTQLTTLDCSSNQLSTLDVSTLTNLTTLWCSTNQLSTLDVSGLIKLTSLGCSYNYMPAESAVTGLNKSITTNFYFEPQKTDTTAPILTSGMVSRTSNTEATIGFTTDEAGIAYYTVVSSGESAPSKEAVVAGASLDSVSGTVTGKSITLTSGAKDIYVAVKDAVGNISEPLKIEAAAYYVPGGSITGTMVIEGQGVSLNDGAKSGTGWDWNAATATLTLNGSYGEQSINIQCGASDTINLVLAGNATLKGGSSSAIGCAGNLKIKAGEYKLNLSASDNGKNALSAMGSIAIESGTVVADSELSNGVYASGDITISGSASVTANGYPDPSSSGAHGIQSAGGDILINTTGTVVAEGGIDGMTARQITVEKGTVTAKGGYAYAMSGRNGITVTGGIVTTGIIDGGKATGGDVDCNLTVSGTGTEVTVNGSITNSGSLTVSGGTVTITGTVAGSQDLTGGTVRIGGVQVYPAVTVTLNINEANFPDAKFRAWLTDSSNIGGVGADSVLTAAEIAGITRMEVPLQGIASLKGIEHFTALTTLYCASNQLETLDVSGLTNLTELNCGVNQLKTLDVSALTNLTELNCDDNQLKTLDVSALTNLTNLRCSNNQLKTLDVSGLSALKTLYCASNQLETLNVSGLSALETLGCSSNRLSTLNVGTLTNLISLDCSSNQLSILEVSGLSALRGLRCSSNQLRTLNVSGLSALETLDCSKNYMPAESAVTGLNRSITIDFTFDPQNSGSAAPVITTTTLQDTIVGDSMYVAALSASGTAPITWTLESGTLPPGLNLSSGGGIDGGATTEGTYTFTLKAANASGSDTKTYTIRVYPASTSLYTVTFDLNGGTRTGGGELTQTIVSGSSATAPTVSRSGYTFTGWDKAFANVTSTLTVTANWSYNGGGGNGGGSGGGSSSGGSSGSTTTTTTPGKTPDQPVTATTPVTATAGTNGAASASIPEKSITDAIAKAQADAKAQGKTANGTTIALNVTMPKGATSLTTHLTRTSLNSLVSAGVTSLKLNGSPVTLSFDTKALAEIQKQSTGNISITIVPNAKLSASAKTMIGTRPVYDLTVSYTKDGKNATVSSFGGGTATVSVPYTPAKGEAIGGLYAVYVDAKGNATRIAGSAYDVNSGCVMFTTTHFSLYGIGYTAPSAKFTDITTHWAKESIDYVVGRGLLSGTAETTFAPDTAMTRGMLVTTLGRLANVDTKAYTTNSFTDVTLGSAFQPYIEWAYKKGIVQGTGNGKFEPDRAITREEIAVIFANFAKATGYTLPVTRTATTYADASSVGSTYKTAVTAMQQAGIMMGGASNKFNPQANATRAEVSSMLYRYIKLTIDPATAQGWAENDAGQYLYYKDGKALTGTQTIDGVKYFFETNGTLKTGWVQDGGNWYFYSGNIRLIGWWDIGANGNNKRYYFDTYGNMVSGKWLEIDGKWYYFNADGSLAVSTKIDGYEVDANGVRK